MVVAIEYINLIPPDDHGLTDTSVFDLAHERLLVASGAKPSKKSALPTPARSTSRAPTASYPYDSYTGVQQVLTKTIYYTSTAQPPIQPSYGTPLYGTPNGGLNTYTPNLYAPTTSSSMVSPSPVPLSSPVPKQPPPRKVDKPVGGWNDTPPIATKSSNSWAIPKRAPIVSHSLGPRLHLKCTVLVYLLTGYHCRLPVATLP
jgi:hypothetical protein